MAENAPKKPEVDEYGVPFISLDLDDEAKLLEEIGDALKNGTAVSTTTGKTALRAGEEDPFKQLPPEREKALRRAFQGLPPE